MLVHIENLVKRYGDLLALDQTVPVKPPPSTACSHC